MGDSGELDNDASTRQGGTYSLLLDVPERRTLEVGALGSLAFESGWYAYTGSAFGPGGFARVERHRELAAGERDVRHWHLDYLLGADAVAIEAVWTSPGADRECAIATELPGEPIEAFGASDCDCKAHLLGSEDRDTLVSGLAALHHRRGVPRD